MSDKVIIGKEELKEFIYKVVPSAEMLVSFNQEYDKLQKLDPPKDLPTLVSKTYIKVLDVHQESYPIGYIVEFQMFSNNKKTLSYDWVECDARELDRTEFHKLFEKIGTTYGEGNGTTTFNIPGSSHFEPNLTTLPDEWKKS